MKKFALAAATLPFLAFSALAETPTPTFVEKATAGNTFEIDSSNLALQKSSNAKVKSFAKEMVKDHTKAAQNMMKAEKAGKVQGMAAQLAPEQQSTMASLNSASGEDFDRQYIKAQVKAHDETIMLFQDYASTGDNQALKTFAKNTLPTLKKHQQHVAKLATSAGM